MRVAACFELEAAVVTALLILLLVLILLLHLQVLGSHTAESLRLGSAIHNGRRAPIGRDQVKSQSLKALAQAVHGVVTRAVLVAWRH